MTRQLPSKVTIGWSILGLISLVCNESNGFIPYLRQERHQPTAAGDITTNSLLDTSIDEPGFGFGHRRNHDGESCSTTLFAGRKKKVKRKKKPTTEASAEPAAATEVDVVPEPEPVKQEEPVPEPVPAPAPAPAPGGNSVTPKTIKQLRDATGAGMMDCKKALLETDGDQEAAAEFLRKKGLAKADKKAARVAAEGKIAYASGDEKAVMVEVNCETDFVGKDATFLEFCDKVANAALAVGDVESLMTQEADGETLESTRQAMVAKIGENIQVRRMETRGGEGSTVGGYIHMNRIGVLVELKGGSEQLCTDVAMHVAAMSPPYATADDVPAAVLEKEKSVLSAQALESGKPPEIVEKMVEGRIRKYLEEICLVSQNFVKDSDKTVGQYLEANGAKMIGFTRIAVGEGIEKKVDNFAEEVAQMAGNKRTEPDTKAEDEAKAAEEARLAEEKKLAEEKAAEEAKLKAAEEEARIAAEKKAEEEARLAEEKRIAEKKAAEEARLKAEEEARLAEAKRIEEAKAAEEEARKKAAADLQPRDDGPVTLTAMNVKDVVAGKTAPDLKTPRLQNPGTASGMGSNALGGKSSGGSDFEKILEDARRMQEEDGSMSSSEEEEGDIKTKIRDVVSTIVTVDFFVVCAFLLWFLAGIFQSSVLKDDTIQIAFNSNFQAFVQPALGVLMIAALASNFLGDEEDDN